MTVEAVLWDGKNSSFDEIVALVNEDTYFYGGVMLVPLCLDHPTECMERIRERVRDDFPAVDFTDVLEALGYARIFDLSMNKEKTYLMFEEGCDGAFQYPVNKKELFQLIMKLLAIYEDMEDGTT